MCQFCHTRPNAPKEMNDFFAPFSLALCKSQMINADFALHYALHIVNFCAQKLALHIVQICCV